MFIAKHNLSCCSLSQLRGRHSFFNTSVFCLFVFCIAISNLASLEGFLLSVLKGRATPQQTWTPRHPTSLPFPNLANTATTLKNPSTHPTQLLLQGGGGGHLPATKRILVQITNSKFSLQNSTRTDSLSEVQKVGPKDFACTVRANACATPPNLPRV